MGVAADWLSVPSEAWPAALARVRAAGVEVSVGEPEGGNTWYACTRGPCRVELGHCPADAGREAVAYCPASRIWRRPLGTWRLLRDVRLAVLGPAGRLHATHRTP